MAIPAETFFIKPDNETTLQQQIQRLVVEAILSGRCLPGEKMPSTRKLAKHLGIARITVTIAYTELVSNEYLESRGRSGYFVAQTAPSRPTFDLPDQADRSQVDWSRTIGQRFSEHITLVRPENWRDYKYPFIYGQFDPRLFDHHNWRNCALKAVGRKDFDTLATDYYERDDPMLVEFILRQILPRRGINAKPEEILITMGAQHALWITAQILLTQRRTAVMENPCYPGLRQILAQTRCNTVSVDVDGSGLPPEDLPEALDVVFTTPSHHCPTNATMPFDRRKRLLERAARDGFIIVEDDYEFEISFLKSPSPALKSIDPTGSVIYIGSFSKSMFPGLRLGYIVASEPFIREARALRSLVLRHPPGLIQRTAAYFLSLGHYDAQITRMGRTYRKRRSTMEYSMKEHGLFQSEQDTFGGSSFWMRAPEGVDSSELAMRLRKHGVLIEPGRAFFASDQEQPGFYRLAYSSIAAARIPGGISLLAQELGKAG
ncbi:PLP-dependent aminotransferase family protein [Roseibium sp.]|uniref:MocR-like pyridoxine biosynthesis transcription factor PdxR n=1 Tax=Roseibium sp. TaxID=1936156 RepID=UPI0039F0C714